MKSTIYYAIAEADFIFKRALTETISRSPFYKLAHIASNGHELINALRKHPPDIILADLFMPVLSGVEAIKFIRLIDKSLPVICYAHTYQQDIADMLAPLKPLIYCEKKIEVIVGMLDFFLKGASMDNAAYEKQWAKESNENIHAILSKEPAADFTITELRLMKLTYEGHTNKEIALLMNLSTRTVDTYLNRLTERLGLRSKLDLIRYAVEHGIYNTSS